MFTHFGEAASFFYEKFACSAPLRFKRYLELSGERELEAIAKYRWNLELSEALIPCLHSAELALRNSIHEAMIQKYLPAPKSVYPDGKQADSEWWFNVEVRGNPLLEDRDYEKVKEAYVKVPKNGKPITPRVVAELSFGFWVELLNSGYDESIVVPTLGSTMKRVQADNRANRRHGWLRERFGEIRDLRNRVTHHEPICFSPDLEFSWQMAWQLSREIGPWFAAVIQPACRFDSVRRAGWKHHELFLRDRVRN